MYRKLGSKVTSQTTIFNVLGSLYTACLFLGILNSIFVQPVISDERAVMYRERGAGMYAIVPWYCGLAAVELIYLLIQGVLYSCVVCKLLHRCGYE
jgi:hypothetical protein